MYEAFEYQRTFPPVKVTEAIVTINVEFCKNQKVGHEWNQVWNQVCYQVWGPVWYTIWSQVSDNVEADLPKCAMGTTKPPEE